MLTAQPIDRTVSSLLATAARRKAHQEAFSTPIYVFVTQFRNSFVPDSLLSQ